MSQDYSDSEPVRVRDSRTATARVEHKCDACDRKVKPGERYHTDKWLSEDGWYIVKRCASCETIYRHLCDRARERIKAGEQDSCEWPDAELNCGHTYAKIHGHEPPPEIAALAFALPGEVEL